MTLEGRKEGLRAPLFCLVTALAALLIPIATAQTVNRSDLELCAGLETSELKLACFEAIIAASKMDELRDRTATTPTVTDKADDVDSVVRSPEIQVAVEASPTAMPAATVQNSADDFGEEYIERKTAPGEVEVISATVTEVRRASNKKLYFRLSNGHVWRQMERGYIQYPRAEEFEIEISQGMMGDYRLRVGGKGRMTRIVRVE